MRIALVIDRFDARKGGGEGYAVSLAKALAKRGHQVHVFSHGWTNGAHDIRFHHLPLISYPRWAKVLSLALSARRAVGSGRFDVVQGFGGVPCVDVHRPGGGVELAWLGQEIKSRENRVDRLTTAARRILSLKLVTNLVLERAVYGPRARQMVVANSQKVKEDILRFYGSSATQRVRIIRNGVDIERFHPKNRSRYSMEVRTAHALGDHCVVMLFMAHNFKLKGLHCLVRALEPVRQHGNWILLVAGRGNKRHFEGLAAKCGIGDRVRFLMQVDHPETVLGACDLLIHPTFYDPFSNVCLEAMASGVPVITTKCNGASEIIRNEASGYVVEDPRSSEDLRRSILKLLNPDRRARMGREARQVAERFSWDAHVEEMESLYTVVCGKKVEES